MDEIYLNRRLNFAESAFLATSTSAEPRSYLRVRAEVKSPFLSLECHTQEIFMDHAQLPDTAVFLERDVWGMRACFGVAIGGVRMGMGHEWSSSKNTLRTRNVASVSLYNWVGGLHVVQLLDHNIGDSAFEDSKPEDPKLEDSKREDCFRLQAGARLTWYSVKLRGDYCKVL